MSSTRTHTIVVGKDLEILFSKILVHYEHIDFKLEHISIHESVDVLERRILQAHIFGLEYFKEENDDKSLFTKNLSEVRKT